MRSFLNALQLFVSLERFSNKMCLSEYCSYVSIKKKKFKNFISGPPLYNKNELYIIPKTYTFKISLTSI